MDQSAFSTSFSDNILQILPSKLSNIMDSLTPYHLRTLETIHRIYGTNSITEAYCFNLSYQRYNLQNNLSHTIPLFNITTYDMKLFTDTHPISSPTPFAPDHNAIILPQVYTTVHDGAMADIIEAIRYTTCIAVTSLPSECTFYPPTAADIQTWLSTKWPEKYPSTHETAQGWRNTVNQCLTHGQGWNFLTFPATDGSKTKRHLLFERAFNKSVIIGSGQCKALNDMKPTKQQKRLSVRCSKSATKSGFNFITEPSYNNISTISPSILSVESNHFENIWPTENTSSSFSELSLQLSTEYNMTELSSPVQFITQPLSTFTNNCSLQTTSSENSNSILWWDTAMQLSMETYISNLDNTFMESKTINPTLLTTDLNII